MPLTVTATVGPEGTTLLVSAPGCQPTPPGEFEIFVQLVSPSGEIGEGAVGAGTFTAPGQGSVLIPAGTPGSSFLLTASCNGDTLTGSLPFVLAAPMPSPPIVAPAGSPADRTRACDSGRHQEPGPSDTRVAEGLGFEPRVTCATMVFETIRFGRSRIPPSPVIVGGGPRRTP